MLHCLQPLIWDYLKRHDFDTISISISAGAWSLAEGIQGLVHCSPCSKKRVKGVGLRV